LFRKGEASPAGRNLPLVSNSSSVFLFEREKSSFANRKELRAHDIKFTFGKGKLFTLRGKKVPLR
jgi:hypothetical protein